MITSTVSSLFDVLQVSKAKQGDIVLINSSLATVQTLQVDHGGWVDSMKSVSY